MHKTHGYGMFQTNRRKMSCTFLKPDNFWNWFEKKKSIT